MKKTRHFFSLFVLAAGLLASSASLASASRGAVRVECNGPCSNVKLGEICNTLHSGAVAVQVSCNGSNTNGVLGSCGSNPNCYVAEYSSFQELSAFCDDGSGNDAIVTCEF